MIDEQLQEQAALYVIGLLEPEEVLRFESLVAANPDLARLVATLEKSAAALALSEPPIDPPPELKNRILTEIRPAVIPIRRSQPGVWLPWSLAACFALIAGGLFMEERPLHKRIGELLADNIAARRDNQELQESIASSQSELESLRTRTALAQKEIEELRERDALAQIRIATLSSLVANEPKAVAVVAWNEQTQHGIVKCANMPAPSAGQDYQLWVIDSKYKQPVSAGVFDAASRTEFQPAQPVSQPEKFAVSVEPKGGSPEPIGQIVMLGQ